MKRLAFAALVVVVACGGKPKTGQVEHVDTMAHAEHKEGDHPTMPDAVAAFHEKLSPLWHAAPGAERTSNTCGEAEVMGMQLEQVATAGAPAGVDAAAWGERVTALQAAWTQLGEDCAQHDAEDFEAKFTAAHDAFHRLIELLPVANK